MSTNNSTWTRVRTITVLNNSGGTLLIHQEWRSNGTNSFTIRLTMEVNRTVSQNHQSGGVRMVINGTEFSETNRTWNFNPGTHQIFSITRNLSQIGGDPSRVQLGRFSWRGTDGSSFGWGPVVGTARWFNENGTITVRMGNPPAVGGSLSASPTTIIAGQRTTLSWSTTNATSISINQGVGSVTPVSGGTRNVTINNSGTITFTATISGPGGTITRSASVTVNPDIPTNAMRWPSNDPIRTQASGTGDVFWLWP